MKEKQKILSRVIIFSLIVVITLAGLNKFFKPAFFGWNIFYTLNGFYEEPEESIETLFLGSSVVARGITPTELYEEYGICSYNLSIANAPMLISYYWLEEAYRYQSDSLKTVVFDVSALRSDADPETYHKSLDGMKLSKVKWNAIKDYVEDDYSEMASFIFPLIFYHDRWDDINSSDVEKYTEDPINGTRGYHYTTFKNAIDRLEGDDDTKKKLPKVFNSELEESTEKFELLENSMFYFEKMVDFCKERNIELVLVKVPTNRWSARLHNAVEEVAKENGLKFWDYNYDPLYDETDILYAYETSDVNHLNYFGASKFTKHLGQMLVDNCDVTDVRGDEKYAYMEEHLEKYHQSIQNEVSLETSETIEEYLRNALKYDNTIMLSVKNSASLALTDQQRDYFSEIGLKKLSEINFRDSYIGIIENGKVIYEDLKLASNEEEEAGKFISYKGVLPNGTHYEVKSGGTYQGEITDCIIDEESYTVDGNGLNLTVYNNKVERVVDYAAFQTNASRSREVYGSKTCKGIFEGTVTVSYDSNSLYSNISEYLDRKKDSDKARETRKKMGDNDIFTFLNSYWNEDNIILFSVRDDAAQNLSEEDRKTFEKMGLVNLADIAYRDSYLGYVDGGKVVYDSRSEGATPIVADELGIYLKSGGRYAGCVSSIQINGVEYSEDETGLNVVVYNKKLKRVVDQEVFNTSQKAIVRNN